MAGGMAITRLNEIADALSVMPTVLTWLIKKLTTSNMGMPRKPGSDVVLLLLTIRFAGAEEAMRFPILENSGITWQRWLF